MTPGRDERLGSGIGAASIASLSFTKLVVTTPTASAPRPCAADWRATSDPPRRLSSRRPHRHRGAFVGAGADDFDPGGRASAARPLRRGAAGAGAYTGTICRNVGCWKRIL